MNLRFDQSSPVQPNPGKRKSQKNPFFSKNLKILKIFIFFLFLLKNATLLYLPRGWTSKILRYDQLNCLA